MINIQPSKEFKWIHLFICIALICFSLFILYVLKCILEEKGWLNNKLEGYFRKSYPKLDNLKPNESKGEAHAREIAKLIFNKSFEKIRPDILKNNVTGHNLELDLYNDELKLGIEYSGVQHYKYVPFFHKNRDAFHNQKYRDELKRRMCKDHNITLIEVPYNIHHEDIERYIISELSKHGYK